MIALVPAAKQEAFEESIKLKNQFRNLDEDEIEFLDSVLESTRAKEEAVKKETTEQLNLFRRQQEEADKALLEETEEAATEGNETGKARSPTAGESHWTINARKRKRAKEKEILKGVKLRKSSTNERPVELVAAKSEGALNKPEEKGAHAATKVKEKETAEKKASSLAPRDIATANTSPSQDIKDSPKPGGTLGLSLAGYSSDEED